MKKTFKTKVFAAVLAAVCSVSAVTTASIMGASAASQNASSQTQSSKSAVIVNKTKSSTFVLPIKGEDWNYFANTLNVKVTCDFDYIKNICNFKFTAVKSGVTDVILKTQRADGKWDNTPVRITVDSQLLMNIVQTDSPYITEKSYTTEPVKNSSQQSNTTKTENNTQTSQAESGTVIAKNAANPFKLNLKGYDWNYYADSLNVKISCDFDYARNICGFIFTAVKPGTTNAVLKTQNADGKWTNTPVRITADNNLKITVVQTGYPFITNSSRTA